MLIAGRILGWILILVALLMASGDAVLALGTGAHAGIVAGDLWMLVAGHAPEASAPSTTFGATILAWPAWAAIGPVGIIMVAALRPRRSRKLRFRKI